jgi:hypothetical protein
MATAKLRIDLAHGLIEAEGDDKFVLQVYQDFKDRLSSTPATPARAHANPETGQATTAKTAPPKAKKKQPSSPAKDTKEKKRPKGTFEMLKDLDLVGSPAGKLKEFYDGFVTKTNYEKNLIFIYFMKQKMEVKVTENHVFTCYRQLGIKVPKALRQSLFDTAGDRGWIVTSDMSDIEVTIHGINHLEHELPKAPAKA